MGGGGNVVTGLVPRMWYAQCHPGKDTEHGAGGGGSPEQTPRTEDRLPGHGLLAGSAPRSPCGMRGAGENTRMSHLKHGSLSGKSITHGRFDFRVIHQAVPKPMEFS